MAKTFTPEQIEFIKLIAKPSVFESTTDDNGNYEIPVKIKGQWQHKTWTPVQIQPLVDAGWLVQMPNRFDHEHMTVVIDRYRREELLQAVSRD